MLCLPVQTNTPKNDETLHKNRPKRKQEKTRCGALKIPAKPFLPKAPKIQLKNSKTFTSDSLILAGFKLLPHELHDFMLLLLLNFSIAQTKKLAPRNAELSGSF
ncbi:hypothetical protein [Alishewanella longhuensis]|uniref:hypothetical protein n=1 Tax=Alishewanella longhuensis TaxID=1091037 RepID=UPI0016791A72|nr:hypothetical protein [Alishewanella longhuensis]